MNGHHIGRMIAGGSALALVPAVWIFTFDAVPSFAEIRASHTADIVGVWIFTWALTWTVTICGAGIAWLCWAVDTEEAADAGVGRDAA